MIINQTRKTIISQQERICTSFLSQALGLMFRPRQNLLMIFPEERKISLHMFFVFYPIAVLVVDKNWRVVEIKENFRPFTFWTSKEKGKCVVELGRKHPVVKISDRIYLEHEAYCPKDNWKKALYGKKICRGILTPEDTLVIRKKFRAGFMMRR